MTEFTYPEIPTYPPDYLFPSQEIDQKAIHIDISGYQVTISDPVTIFFATFYQQYFYCEIGLNIFENCHNKMTQPFFL